MNHYDRGASTVIGWGLLFGAAVYFGLHIAHHVLVVVL